MKNFIDNSKSYSLEDINRLMHNLEGKASEYETLIDTENFSIYSVKRNHLFASVFVASIASLSLAATVAPLDEQKVFQQKITKTDKSHSDYIEFITSKAVSISNRENEIIEEIISFKSLKENWDGCGAIPSENKSAVNAIVLISKLKSSVLNKINSVFPTSNGTVSFIWENKDEERVSFEIGTENYSFYAKLNNLKPSFFNGLVSDNNWISILEKEVHKL